MTFLNRTHRDWGTSTPGPAGGLGLCGASPSPPERLGRSCRAGIAGRDCVMPAVTAVPAELPGKLRSAAAAAMQRGTARDLPRSWLAETQEDAQGVVSQCEGREWGEGGSYLK